MGSGRKTIEIASRTASEAIMAVVIMPEITFGYPVPLKTSNTCPNRSCTLEMYRQECIWRILARSGVHRHRCRPDLGAWHAQVKDRSKTMAVMLRVLRQYICIYMYTYIHQCEHMHIHTQSNAEQSKAEHSASVSEHSDFEQATRMRFGTAFSSANAEKGKQCFQLYKL